MACEPVQSKERCWVLAQGPYEVAIEREWVVEQTLFLRRWGETVSDKVQKEM